MCQQEAGAGISFTFVAACSLVSRSTPNGWPSRVPDTAARRSGRELRCRGRAFRFLADRDPGLPERRGIAAVDHRVARAHRARPSRCCQSHRSITVRGSRQAGIGWPLASSRKGRDIYTYDWQRDQMVRLTFNGDTNADPVWAPDGKHIVFRGGITTTPAVWWVRADGTGSPVRLLEIKAGDLGPNSFSPDGRRLIFSAPETAAARICGPCRWTYSIPIIRSRESRSRFWYRPPTKRDPRSPPMGTGWRTSRMKGPHGRSTFAPHPPPRPGPMGSGRCPWAAAGNRCGPASGLSFFQVREPDDGRDVLDGGGYLHREQAARLGHVCEVGTPASRAWTSTRAESGSRSSRVQAPRPGRRRRGSRCSSISSRRSGGSLRGSDHRAEALV